MERTKILTTQAVLAPATDAVEVPQANALADLGGLDVAANLLDHAYALVTECLAGVEVVEIGATEAGVGDADKDLSRLEGACYLTGTDSAVVVAVEGVEGDGHFLDGSG